MDELTSLSDDDLKSLLKRLAHHALCKMRRLTWRGATVRKGGSVPGAYEPEDFVNDAIRKLLDGTRVWNKEATPSLLEALKSTIDSDINHMVETVDNSRGRRLAIRGKHDETMQVYDIPGTEQNPLQLVVDKDWKDRYRIAAMKAIGDDALLVKLYECLEADITEPSDIACMLEVPVNEVNNGKKRLRRKLEKLDKKFPCNRRRAS